MDLTQKMVEYSEETGGLFSAGNIEAIPYNHWRKDFEWLVMVIEPLSGGAFVTVEALTAREACTTAIYKYLTMKENDE